MRGDLDDDNDFLDAGCEPGLEFLNRVKEEDTPYLVLFADVDWDDKEALAHRAQEWLELFGGDDNGS
jgi:hypothetical protein